MIKGAPQMVQRVGAGAAPALRQVAQPQMRPESIQQHLEKVVGSAEMRRSKKLCQFLRFTVTEVLCGHGSELKEYAIAVGVFRRGREFDPGADPIVRVQARRLRSKLQRYYQNEGCDEPVQIEYPVGGYSPIFSRREAARAPEAVAVAPLEATPALIASTRHIAVLPFIGVGAQGSEAFGDGLTDELMYALSGWPGVSVIARTSCFQFKARSEDARRIGEWLGVFALVTGSVRIEGSRLRVMAQLIDAASGVNLWSTAYDRELDGVLDTQQQISREIALIVKSQLTFGTA
jgi:TolB-like protein